MSQSSKFTLYRNGNDYYAKINNVTPEEVVQSLGGATGEITLDENLTMTENELGVNTEALTDAIGDDIFLDVMAEVQDHYQPLLESGINIATVDNQDLLASGAITTDGSLLICNYTISLGAVAEAVSLAIGRHRPISFVQDTGTVTYYYAGSVGAQIAYVAHVWDTFGMGHKMFLYRNGSIENIITYDYETPII